MAPFPSPGANRERQRGSEGQPFRVPVARRTPPGRSRGKTTRRPGGTRRPSHSPKLGFFWAQILQPFSESKPTWTR